MKNEKGAVLRAWVKTVMVVPKYDYSDVTATFYNAL